VVVILMIRHGGGRGGADILLAWLVWPRLPRNRRYDLFVDADDTRPLGPDAPGRVVGSWRTSWLALVVSSSPLPALPPSIVDGELPMMLLL
jgi:hypothetical protein